MNGFSFKVTCIVIVSQTNLIQFWHLFVWLGNSEWIKLPSGLIKLPSGFNYPVPSQGFGPGLIGPSVQQYFEVINFWSINASNRWWCFGNQFDTPLHSLCWRRISWEVDDWNFTSDNEHFNVLLGHGRAGRGGSVTAVFCQFIISMLSIAQKFNRAT